MVKTPQNNNLVCSTGWWASEANVDTNRVLFSFFEQTMNLGFGCSEDYFKCARGVSKR
jgi:hypothetical protein